MLPAIAPKNIYPGKIRPSANGKWYDLMITLRIRTGSSGYLLFIFNALYFDSDLALRHSDIPKTLFRTTQLVISQFLTVVTSNSQCHYNGVLK